MKCPICKGEIRKSHFAFHLQNTHKLTEEQIENFSTKTTLLKCDYCPKQIKVGKMKKHLEHFHPSKIKKEVNLGACSLMKGLDGVTSSRNWKKRSRRNNNFLFISNNFMSYNNG